MTRRLLIGLAAVLALGALLDTTAPDERVGLRTVGERLQASNDPAAGHFQAFDLVERARAYGGGISGVTIHAALRDLVPGANLIVDETIPAARLSSLYLRGIGGANSVVIGDLTHVAAPDGPPTAEGLYFTGVWQRSWAMWTAGGVEPMLLVVQDGDTTNVIDVSLLADRSRLAGLLEGAATELGRSGRPPIAAMHPGLLRAALAEWTVLMLLFFLGGVLLPRSSFRLGLRLPLALIVGAALHASLAVLLLPGRPALIVTTVVAASFAVVAQKAGQPVGWRARDVPWAVAAGIATGLIVVWARMWPAIPVGTDFFDYMSGAAVLARGDFGLGDLEIKRGLSQQALHAAGFVLGAGGVPTIGHVMLVAGLLILVVVAVAHSGRSRRSPAALVAMLFVLAIVLSPQLRTHAAISNGHVLVATLLLGLVVLIGADSRRALLPALSAVIGALVLARPEGATLVALVLLGASIGRRTTNKRATADLIAPWFILGVVSLIWGGMLTAGALLRDGDRELATDLLLLIGLVALAAGWLQRVTSERAWRSIVLAGGTGLWVVTLVLLTQERVNFLEAAVANVGRGAGGWGVIGPALLIVATVGLVLTAGSGAVHVQSARWLIIGFVPVAVLSKLGDGLQASDAGLELLLSGGGRVGWGDSMNRMWMHAVLVVGYLLVMAAAPRDRSSPRDGTVRSTPTRIPVGAVPLLTLFMFGPWVALQWQPNYVPWEVSTEEMQLLDVPGLEAMVELTDRTFVEQRVRLEISELREGFQPLALCIDVPLVTFGRDIEGEVLLELEQAGRSSRRVIEQDRVFDWAPYRVCVDLEPHAAPRSGPIGAVVRVTSVGGIEGAAPGVLRADRSPAFGASITRTDPDGVRIERADHLALSASLIIEQPPGAFDRPLQRASLVLPWIVLLLGSAAVLARLRNGI